MPKIASIKEEHDFSLTIYLILTNELCELCIVFIFLRSLFLFCFCCAHQCSQMNTTAPVLQKNYRVFTLLNYNKRSGSTATRENITAAAAIAVKIKLNKKLKKKKIVKTTSFISIYKYFGTYEERSSLAESNSNAESTLS